MAASTLNPFAVACLLALVVATACPPGWAGASRTTIANSKDPDAEETRPCHSNNAWSGHLYRYACQASGFSRYDFALPSVATDNQARYCCPMDDKHACLCVTV